MSGPMSARKIRHVELDGQGSGHGTCCSHDGAVRRTDPGTVRRTVPGFSVGLSGVHVRGLAPPCEQHINVHLQHTFSETFDLLLCRDKFCGVYIFFPSVIYGSHERNEWHLLLIGFININLPLNYGADFTESFNPLPQTKFYAPRADIINRRFVCITVLRC
jgi:hypothetical protein